MNTRIAIVFLQLLIASNGDIELACGTARPSGQTDVTCVCRNTVGSDIQWSFNGTFLSDCVLKAGCLPQPPGYIFSINMSEIAFEMTISAYDYNDCTQINCTDPSNTKVQRMVVPSAIDFDQSNPPPISEPALSNNNGNISITTGCISGYTDLTCEWYTVYNNGKPEEYTDGQFHFNANDKSACSDCNDDMNAKKTCGFYHMEASGNETKNVNFRVVVTHTPTDSKWEVNSANVYTVKVNKPSESDRPANNKLRNGLIALVVVIVIIVIIVIITLICVRPKLTNIKLENKQIHLEWKDGLNCCCCCQRIFGYSIVRKPKQGQVTDITCKENFTKEKHCTLEKLDPMAIYEICLSRKLWCFTSSAQPRSVITRKLDMLNDQGNNAKPQSIDVWWTKPYCITNPQMKYKVTCNEKVTEENNGEIKSKIKGLFPKKTYTIKVFAIDNGINSLLFAEEITTTDLKVSLRDVCYQLGESCVECNIKWTVEDVLIPEHDDDIPDHLDESNTVYFNVICYSEKQVVHKKEKIRASSYTIPKLYPDRSYSVYVYPVYHSVTFKPDMIELTTPYKPTKLKPTEVKSTVIDVTWKKPDYTNGQRLQYKVFCKDKVDKTNQTSSKIKNLVPGQTYEIKIFTILKGINSLPSEKTIQTPPLKVSLKVDGYNPEEESYVKCNIIWTVKDFDRPEPFNKPDDEFLYNVELYSRNQLVHTSNGITDSSYTIPDIYPDRSYTVDVYAIYHSITLKPPGKIQLTPYKPTNLKYTAKPTQIELKWERPQYTGNQPLTYDVTCDQVRVNTTSETSYKIENLEPCQQYDIEILTIIHRMKSLPLQQTIRTQPLKVSFGDVCYKPGQSCVECEITWTVKDFDIQEHLNEPDKFYFKVKWCSDNQEVCEEKKTRASSFTIPELYPDRSYSVYVYPVYNSVTFEHDIIELTTPYIPTWRSKPTSKPREIEFKWKKPEYTRKQPLKYQVTCVQARVSTTTSKTSYKIKNLEPCQCYDIEIFTIINEENKMKSLPFKVTIRTQPSQQVPLPEIQLGAHNVNLVSQQRF